MASQELVFATSILLVIYMAVILFFVIRGALKIKSISDYAVGNVQFSPAAVGLSLAASTTSAATFIINPGFIAFYCLSGVLAFAVVMPLVIFVSLIIVTALTMAQWIGKRYESKN